MRRANPALKLATLINADSISPTLVSLLSLDDPQVARNFYREPGLISTSSDPLVQWVDKILYNDGQPLTAGSADLYGTYYDPRTAAGFKVMTFIVTAVASAVVGFGAGGLGGAAAMGGIIAGDVAGGQCDRNSTSTSIFVCVRNKFFCEL